MTLRKACCFVLLSVFMSFNIFAADEVYIENSRQAIGKIFEFKVDQGKLFYRIRGGLDDGTSSRQWRSFGLRGIPVDQKGKPLRKKFYLKEVYADGDVFIVVNENNQIYQWGTDTKVFAGTRPYKWKSEWGAPFGEDFFLRGKYRDMAFARRTFNTVGILQDPTGQGLRAGGDATMVTTKNKSPGSSGLIHIYLLSENGRRLYFADTGLPVGTNYEFSMPLRGSVEGVAVEASSSTVMLMDNSGAIWTRLLDFDWRGSNPMMFDYHYVRGGGKSIVSPASRPLHDHEVYGKIALPAEPWYRQERIHLIGKAAISKEITILTTGIGNAERELRVAGKNPFGTCGYYSKRIFAKHWNFVPTPRSCFKKSNFIKQGPVKFLLNSERNLEGRIKIKKRSYKLKINNYSTTSDDVAFEIQSYKGKKAISKGTLHLVPAWSPLGIKHPGRDGSFKLFYGTFEFDKVSPELKYLDLKTFSIFVRGTEDEVWIESDGDKIYGDAVDVKAKDNNHVWRHMKRNKRLGSCTGSKKSFKRDKKYFEGVIKRLKKDRDTLWRYRAGGKVVDALGTATTVKYWVPAIGSFPPTKNLIPWGTLILRQQHESSFDAHRLSKYAYNYFLNNCR